jgi:hypothetical protein
MNGVFLAQNQIIFLYVEFGSIQDQSETGLPP